MEGIFIYPGAHTIKLIYTKSVGFHYKADKYNYLDWASLKKY